MKKVLKYIIPELLVPVVFGYYFWEAGSAEGWGGWAYGILLGKIMFGSALLGLLTLGFAWIQKRRGKQDWRWLIISAGIIGSPALFAILYQLFK